MSKWIIFGLAVVLFGSAEFTPAPGQDKKQEKKAEPLQLTDLSVTGAADAPPSVSFTIRIKGGKGRQDMWVGVGDPQVMKKFADQVKGPLADRLGLLDLSGPGFFIGPVGDWKKDPKQADVSLCKMDFKKITLNDPVAPVTVMVFEDGGEVALQTVRVNFRTGKKADAK
jgi:hypothetical protein